jgi:Xaa-Pro aminopeptidase
VNNRLQKLRDKLAEKQIDAIFITQADNRRYLSGFHGTAGHLIIAQKQAILATDFRYIEQAKAEAPGFIIHRVAGNIYNWLTALTNDLKIKQMGFESGDVTYDFYRQLRRALRKAGSTVKLVPMNGLVEEIRAIKESEEIKLIAQASVITDATFKYVASRIKAGMTEKQVAWELEKTLRENGSESPLFDIIVGSGPNSALPHAKPTDRIICEDEPIVIDMGARYRGYTSDFTRTLCIGKTDNKFIKVYSVVLEAQQQAEARIIRGMTGKEADAIARKVIEKAGYSEAFGHSLGHGVGLAEHEQPRLGPNSEDKLTDGMVFTIEPGIYLPDWGGIRIEDTVVMEEGKVKMLTQVNKIKV